MATHSSTYRRNPSAGEPIEGGSASMRVDSVEAAAMAC